MVSGRIFDRLPGFRGPNGTWSGDIRPSCGRGSARTPSRLAALARQRLLGHRARRVASRSRRPPTPNSTQVLAFDPKTGPGALDFRSRSPDRRTRRLKRRTDLDARSSRLARLHDQHAGQTGSAGRIVRRADLGSAPRGGSPERPADLRLFDIGSGRRRCDRRPVWRRDGALVGLDAGSGAMRWRAFRDAHYAQSPIVTELAGRTQLTVIGSTRVAGIDPKSGDELWSPPAWRHGRVWS